jgi:drug/metabolite transporter (DMT)-like permease
MKNTSHLYIILAGVCLGSIGVLVKLVGTDMHFMTLSFFRTFLGFIFLLIFVPFIDRNTFKIKKQDLKEYSKVGLLFAIVLTAANTAFVFAPVQNVVMITTTIPFFVLLFSYYLLKEKITSTKLITLLMAMMGLFIIYSTSQPSIFLIGNIIALFTAVFAALTITEMRLVDKKHSIGDVVWFLFFASLFLLPAPFIFGIGGSSESWVYVLLLGVVSTGLAYFFYNLALENIEAGVASALELITIPLISIALAFFLLNEELNTRILLGGSLLILAGLFLEMHRKKVS